MPQALHPRADPQISSYWQDDTTSSREIARAMEEAEGRADDDDKNDMKKSAVIAISSSENGDGVGARGGRRLQLSTQLLSQLTPSLDPDFDGLRVGDMTHSPIQAQLSPTGLISIAAADIDEAAGNSSQQLPVNAALDWEFIETLRQSGRETASQGDSPNEPRAARLNAIFEDALAQVIAPLPPSRSADQSEEGQENQSKLRFLSLLRRINELRSQQVDTESWDGLPYPQILALPTFKYSVREKREEDAGASSEERINNTLCAVCYTEYAPDEEVRALPCLHFYHRECIDQWLLHHRLCPICKHVVAVY
uniref:RING-type domain-containing protein n=1 Tax=Globisporangium ultimum (strain ATCC 200006 / CBS 805.95 / DAOM BR144) TaxID=431595 RepID=K3X634_GLOUD